MDNCSDTDTVLELLYSTGYQHICADEINSDYKLD